MVFRDGNFEKWLGLDRVIRVEPSWLNTAGNFIRRERERLEDTHTYPTLALLPCDDLSCLGAKKTRWGPWPWTRTVKPNKPLFFRTFPVCGIVLLAIENRLILYALECSFMKLSTAPPMSWPTSQRFWWNLVLINNESKLNNKPINQKLICFLTLVVFYHFFCLLFFKAVLLQVLTMIFFIFYLGFITILESGLVSSVHFGKFCYYLY
jgi:hypothetical protein